MTEWEIEPVDSDLPITVEPRKLSNSETTAWLNCQRKWYYAHSLNIAPRSYGIALNRGIVGHDCLAEYYNIIMEGGDSATGIAASNKMLAHAMTNPDNSPDFNNVLLELSVLLKRYYNWTQTEDAGWKIVGVERKFEIPLTADFMYAMRLDLLVEDRTGEVILLDHKFVYDFWQPVALEMNAQMPKYMGALRFNGYKVDKAIISQIRHRVKKSGNTDAESFKRVTIQPTTPEIRQILKEHIQASEEIMAMRALPIEIQKNTVKRNMGMMTCKMCSFVEVCKTELMGGDPTLMIETYYKPNDYSYNLLADKAAE